MHNNNRCYYKSEDAINYFSETSLTLERDFPQHILKKRGYLSRLKRKASVTGSLSSKVLQKEGILGVQYQAVLIATKVKFR